MLVKGQMIPPGMRKTGCCTGLNVSIAEMPKLGDMYTGVLLTEMPEEKNNG
jgi:hypothetical protein